ncbi:MAG: HEPN domain-containing protein [Methylovulum sp.]|nr:HEPN domain-containing protein [Methylovulum sp.]
MNGNLPDEETALIALIDYATRSFRDTADQDYISARMSYRAGLIEPFLWSGLHAIEKYLKAILLFNEKKSKKCGHNIEKLLHRVKEIEGLDLRLPESVESFIRYLNRFGENRYFEGGVLLDSHALDNLDETVWYIRRYCFYIKEFESDYYRNARRIPPLEQEQHPKRQNLSGGVLEEIIKNESAAYDYLIWENFFYVGLSLF